MKGITGITKIAMVSPVSPKPKCWVARGGYDGWDDDDDDDVCRNGKGRHVRMKSTGRTAKKEI
jgi:hypothetical protein